MCGLYGLWGSGREGLRTVVKGLTRVNHRGHEMFGIAATNGTDLFHFRHAGFVRDVCKSGNGRFYAFSQELEAKGACGFVGHTRYSTVGRSDLTQAQPLHLSGGRLGEFVLGHNGQLPHYLELRRELEARGYRFHTESDSEVLAALIAEAETTDLPAAVAEVIGRVAGAFAMLVMNTAMLIAARDRHGFRPLWWQETPSGFCFASEVGALDRRFSCAEVPPGSFVVVGREGNRSVLRELPVLTGVPGYHCLFELLYFTRPDQLFGSRVASGGRRMLGQRLARTCPVRADIVCGIPDAGTDAALGYAEVSGIALEPRAVVKNWYQVPGRSFIEPGVDQRDTSAEDKYAAVPEYVRDQRVVLIDDTIVRGTTMTKLVRMVRDAGAQEVHVRIAAAPIRHPCFYGIDMRTKEELIAGLRETEDGVRAEIGADSLRYLPYDDMMAVAGGLRAGWCSACFTGKYPIPVPVPS